jgi:flagellar biosynthesis protein FliR
MSVTSTGMTERGYASPGGSGQSDLIIAPVQIDLSAWLTLEVYRALLVFVRIGAAFMTLPGYGDPSVPVRVRILAGLATAIAVAPAIPGLPAVVPGAGPMFLAIAAEAFAGALLGTLSRTVISGVLIAGQVIGQNIGLSNVFMTGLATDQAASVGAAIYAGLLALMFVTDAHHLVLRALVGSYGLLPAGRFPDPGDSAKSAVAAGVRAFRLGGQLALPFLLLGLVFNISLAAVNRAMHSLPVFMLGAPLIVLAGLYLLAAVIPGALDQGLAAFADTAALLR